MTQAQISALVQNVTTINKVLNSLDIIGYRDFLHTIYSDYSRLKFVHSTLNDHGFYREIITKEQIMEKVNPQKVDEGFID